jgi:hypothetical protein
MAKDLLNAMYGVDIRGFESAPHLKWPDYLSMVASGLALHKGFSKLTGDPGNDVQKIQTLKDALKYAPEGIIRTAANMTKPIIIDASNKAFNLVGDIGNTIADLEGNPISDLVGSKILGTMIKWGILPEQDSSSTTNLMMKGLKASIQTPIAGPLLMGTGMSVVLDAIDDAIRAGMSSLRIPENAAPFDIMNKLQDTYMNIPATLIQNKLYGNLPAVGQYAAKMAMAAPMLWAGGKLTKTRNPFRLLAGMYGTNKMMQSGLGAISNSLNAKEAINAIKDAYFSHDHQETHVPVFTDRGIEALTASHPGIPELGTILARGLRILSGPVGGLLKNIAEFGLGAYITKTSMGKRSFTEDLHSIKNMRVSPAGTVAGALATYGATKLLLNNYFTKVHYNGVIHNIDALSNSLSTFLDGFLLDDTHRLKFPPLAGSLAAATTAGVGAMMTAKGLKNLGVSKNIRGAAELAGGGYLSFKTIKNLFDLYKNYKMNHALSPSGHIDLGVNSIGALTGLLGTYFGARKLGLKTKAQNAYHEARSLNKNQIKQLYGERFLEMYKTLPYSIQNQITNISNNFFNDKNVSFIKHTNEYKKPLSNMNFISNIYRLVSGLNSLYKYHNNLKARLSNYGQTGTFYSQNEMDPFSSKYSYRVSKKGMYSPSDLYRMHFNKYMMRSQNFEHKEHPLPLTEEMSGPYGPNSVEAYQHYIPDMQDLEYEQYMHHFTHLPPWAYGGEDEAYKKYTQFIANLARAGEANFVKGIQQAPYSAFSVGGDDTTPQYEQRSPVDANMFGPEPIDKIKTATPTEKFLQIPTDLHAASKVASVGSAIGKLELTKPLWNAFLATQSGLRLWNSLYDSLKAFIAFKNDPTWNTAASFGGNTAYAIGNALATYLGGTGLGGLAPLAQTLGGSYFAYDGMRKVLDGFNTYMQTGTIPKLQTIFGAVQTATSAYTALQKMRDIPEGIKNTTENVTPYMPIAKTLSGAYFGKKAISELTDAYKDHLQGKPYSFKGIAGRLGMLGVASIAGFTGSKELIEQARQSQVGAALKDIISSDESMQNKTELVNAFFDKLNNVTGYNFSPEIFGINLADIAGSIPKFHMPTFGSSTQEQAVNGTNESIAATPEEEEKPTPSPTYGPSPDPYANNYVDLFDTIGNVWKKMVNTPKPDPNWEATPEQANYNPKEQKSWSEIFNILTGNNVEGQTPNPQPAPAPGPAPIAPENPYTPPGLGLWDKAKGLFAQQEEPLPNISINQGQVSTPTPSPSPSPREAAMIPPSTPENTIQPSPSPTASPEPVAANTPLPTPPPDGSAVPLMTSNMTESTAIPQQTTVTPTSKPSPTATPMSFWETLKQRMFEDPNEYYNNTGNNDSVPSPQPGPEITAGPQSEGTPWPTPQGTPIQPPEEDEVVRKWLASRRERMQNKSNDLSSVRNRNMTNDWNGGTGFLEGWKNVAGDVNNALDNLIDKASPDVSRENINLSKQLSDNFDEYGQPISLKSILSPQSRPTPTPKPTATLFSIKDWLRRRREERERLKKEREEIERINQEKMTRKYPEGYERPGYMDPVDEGPYYATHPMDQTKVDAMNAQSMTRKYPEGYERPGYMDPADEREYIFKHASGMKMGNIPERIRPIRNTDKLGQPISNYWDKPAKLQNQDHMTNKYTEDYAPPRELTFQSRDWLRKKNEEIERIQKEKEEYRRRFFNANGMKLGVSDSEEQEDWYDSDEYGQPISFPKDKPLTEREADALNLAHIGRKYPESYTGDKDEYRDFDENTKQQIHHYPSNYTGASLDPNNDEYKYTTAFPNNRREKANLLNDLNNEHMTNKYGNSTYEGANGAIGPIYEEPENELIAESRKQIPPYPTGSPNNWRAPAPAGPSPEVTPYIPTMEEYKRDRDAREQKEMDDITRRARKASANQFNRTLTPTMPEGMGSKWRDNDDDENYYVPSKEEYMASSPRKFRLGPRSQMALGLGLLGLGLYGRHVMNNNLRYLKDLRKYFTEGKIRPRSKTIRYRHGARRHHNPIYAKSKVEWYGPPARLTNDLITRALKYDDSGYVNRIFEEDRGNMRQHMPMEKYLFGKGMLFDKIQDRMDHTDFNLPAIKRHIPEWFKGDKSAWKAQTRHSGFRQFLDPKLLSSYDAFWKGPGKSKLHRHILRFQKAYSLPVIASSSVAGIYNFLKGVHGLKEEKEYAKLYTNSTETDKKREEREG